MAAISTKLSSMAWRVVPGMVRRRLQTRAGRQFLRFVPVSLAALASSQVSLILMVGVIGITAGTAGFVASVIGAAVSYVLSRWAWGRKGKPDLLRETLPFWVVSVGAWIFLSFASHEASIWSRSMGHGHWQRVAVVAVVYFLANCLTFAARFLLFHYVLFAGPGDRRRRERRGASGQQNADGQDELPESLELAGEHRSDQPRR